VAQSVEKRRKIVQILLSRLPFFRFRLRFPRGVQPSVPDDDVEPLDFLDQHQDCLAGGSDFSSLIALEPLRPLAQQRELVHIEAAVWHLPILRLYAPLRPASQARLKAAFDSSRFETLDRRGEPVRFEALAL
jgi:hypothetical protein